MFMTSQKHSRLVPVPADAFASKLWERVKGQVSPDEFESTQANHRETAFLKLMEGLLGRSKTVAIAAITFGACCRDAGMCPRETFSTAAEKLCTTIAAQGKYERPGITRSYLFTSCDIPKIREILADAQSGASFLDC